MAASGGAIENRLDPRHDLLAESGHRALDHVVGHRPELEDHREAHQVELACDAENCISHCLRHCRGSPCRWRRSRRSSSRAASALGVARNRSWRAAFRRG